jgi:hypothetical protein
MTTWLDCEPRQKLIDTSQTQHCSLPDDRDSYKQRKTNKRKVEVQNFSIEKYVSTQTVPEQPAHVLDIHTRLEELSRPDSPCSAFQEQSKWSSPIRYELERLSFDKVVSISRATFQLVFGWVFRIPFRNKDPSAILLIDLGLRSVWLTCKG